MIAVLLALLLQSGEATPEIADDDSQWVCTASAKGKYHARVDVGIQLTTSRDILTRNVSWSPPRASRAETSRPDIGAPDLTLHYEYAEAGNIDEATDAFGSVSGIDAPLGTLDDMALGVRIDGSAIWYIALEPMEFEPDEDVYAIPAAASPLDFRSASISSGDTDIDVLEALQTAHMLTLSIVDRKGRPVSQTGYDLSATAERDRLFATAWKKAETLALHPQRCTKAGTE